MRVIGYLFDHRHNMCKYHAVPNTLRKYFPESSTPREMEEKIIGLLEESKTEKVVFRSDSIKKYFPSNYSSEQIENSILKMLDQRMKKRKHEAER